MIITKRCFSKDLVKQIASEKNAGLDPELLQGISQSISRDININLEGREIKQIFGNEEADNDFCLSLVLISGLIAIIIFLVKEN